MKKGFTLIELLAAITIFSIICLVTYPKIMDVIEASKVSAYNSAKKNIIEGAKLKYLADINSINVIEYDVNDLVTDGYLSSDTKNPLTNEKYENTKVLVTNKDGKVTFDYISGNNLFDIINNSEGKNGLYTESNTYLYKGNTLYNYVSFNKEIYRILKMDSYRNVYLVKDEDDILLNKDQIDNYIKIYYNDNYSQNSKDNIIDFDILNYKDYINSYKNNITFINNNSDIWVKDNKEYKVLSYANNTISNKTSAKVRLVLKVKSSTIIESGNGSILEPYLIKE